MIPRHPQWRARLTAVLDDLASAPFAWGKCDCLTGLLHGAVTALIDTDATWAWRGRYRSQRGALRVLRADGFDTLADLAASLLPEIAPDAARLGDIAAIESGDGFGHALGIVNGETLIAFGPDGVGAYPRARMVRAFRVGD